MMVIVMYSCILYYIHNSAVVVGQIIGRNGENGILIMPCIYCRLYILPSWVLK